MQLTTKIFIGMFLGLAFGVACNMLPDGGLQNWLSRWFFDSTFEVVGKIFIASLKVLVVPMVFVSLVCGTATLGGHGRMGPMAVKAIGLYMLTTAMAITIALTLSGITQPGSGQELTANVDYVSKSAPSFKEVLINIFPSNPIKAMAEGNMLQVIVFSILFGLAVSRAGEHGQRVYSSFTAYNDIIMEMVMLLMRLAPYGVFCLLASIFYKTGFGLIRDLASYFLTVVAALLIHALFVYTSLLKLLSGLSPWHFIKQVRPVMMFGFSTASSNATMPVTLETAEEVLGIKNRIASFTVPLGATLNMDGTAIMQGVATVFIAQVYQIDLSVADYATVIVTATLASVGAAGVPGVGLVTLALVLQQVGLPVEGIALIIGVDRLLDMIRTAVNVTGDLTVSSIVAKSENAIDVERYYAVEQLPVK